MISQLLEKKIIDAVRAALEPTGLAVQIFGAWQPAALGEIKNEGASDAVATIAVAVGTAQRETFTADSVRYVGSIGVVVRFEKDPTGAALLSIGDALESLFKSWQAATYQQSFAALDVPGFQLGDVALNGGDISTDFDAGRTTVSWGITLSGSDAE